MYTVHITRLMACHTSHFTRAYKHSQTFINIQSAKGCEKIIVALKKECWKRWNGAVSLIIWLLSDDPGLWAVLGNNIILYGVLHRLDSDEHLIRLLSSLWSTRLGLWCYLSLMSGHCAHNVTITQSGHGASRDGPGVDHGACLRVTCLMMDTEEC